MPTRQSYALVIACARCRDGIDVTAIIEVDAGDASSEPYTDVDLCIERDTRCPLCGADWTLAEIEAMQDAALIAARSQDRRREDESEYDTIAESDEAGL
jgi:hypothetical protein